MAIVVSCHVACPLSTFKTSNQLHGRSLMNRQSLDIKGLRLLVWLHTSRFSGWSSFVISPTSSSLPPRTHSLQQQHKFCFLLSDSLMKVPKTHKVQLESSLVRNCVSALHLVQKICVCGRRKVGTFRNASKLPRAPEESLGPETCVSTDWAIWAPSSKLYAVQAHQSKKPLICSRVWTCLFTTVVGGQYSCIRSCACNLLCHVSDALILVQPYRLVQTMGINWGIWV
jgi:hypothetical protein